MDEIFLLRVVRFPIRESVPMLFNILHIEQPVDLHNCAKEAVEAGMAYEREASKHVISPTQRVKADNDR